MDMKSAKVPFVIAALLASAPVWAHHGSAGFDRNKPVHLIGKITRLEWINPHVVIHLDVAGADGRVAAWLVNTLPPNAAIRKGFSKADFAVGTELAIDGYQAEDGSDKAGSNQVNASNIQLNDGRTIVDPGCFDASGHGLPWGRCAPSAGAYQK